MIMVPDLVFQTEIGSATYRPATVPEIMASLFGFGAIGGALGIVLGWPAMILGGLPVHAWLVRKGRTGWLPYALTGLGVGTFTMLIYFLATGSLRDSSLLLDPIAPAAIRPTDRLPRCEPVLADPPIRPDPGAMTPAPDPAELPSYAGPAARRSFRRIKLALFLSSLAACLFVTLIGVVCTRILMLAMGISGAATNYSMLSGGGFLGGMSGAFQLASYNFLLFFINVPAAWLALGLSIGRLPYRGIMHRKPYVRWGSIWGAILVGGTTSLFGFLAGFVSGTGALLGGAFIGATAGALCGLLFYAIVKPANQLADVDIDVF
jgi:hypothetical protein